MSVTTGFELPALKRLGELAVARPVIIFDTREQRPLVFERLKSRPGTLQTGDYSIAGLETLFSIERKTIDDLANCCTGQNRERFERELHRLRAYRFRRLLIVGAEEDIYRCRYHSSVTPKAIFATLGAFEARFDLPVVFIPCPRLAARKIESYAFWFAREHILAANNLLRAATTDQVCDRVTNGEAVQNGQS
jgi:ERCC4-type nuclease